MKRVDTALRVLAAAAAAATCGCVSLFPKAVPAQLYRFGAGEAAASPRADETALRPVVLEPVEFPRTATSDGILTVTGDQVAYISGARWAAPARILFQEAVAGEFTRRSAKTRLANLGDAGIGALLMRISVLKFEADYGPAGPPVVRIVLSASLSTAGGRAVGERVFTAERPAEANGVRAIVSAFDGATETVVHDLGAWTDAQADAFPSPVQPNSSPAQTTTDTRETTTRTTVSPGPG